MKLCSSFYFFPIILYDFINGHMRTGINVLWNTEHKCWHQTWLVHLHPKLVTNVQLSVLSTTKLTTQVVFRLNYYRSGTVNSNTVNSKFHLIRSYCKYLATILSWLPANEVCEGYVFTGVCLSTRGGHAWLLRGACVVAPGGCAWLLRGGHVWLLLGGCAWLLRGGMHGCSWGGVCGCSGGAMHGCSGGHAWLLPGGHAWLLWEGMCSCSGGACMVAPGGVHGCSWGHVWLLGGACMVAPGGMRGCSGGMCGCSRGVCGSSGGVCVVFSMRYGQWAGGTHPTGMHSCFMFKINS